MAMEIDEEVFRIVEENHKLALDILTDKRKILEEISKALIIWETLNYKQIKSIVDGKDIGLPSFNDKNKKRDNDNNNNGQEEAVEKTEETDEIASVKDPKVVPST